MILRLASNARLAITQVKNILVFHREKLAQFCAIELLNLAKTYLMVVLVVVGPAAKPLPRLRKWAAFHNEPTYQTPTLNFFLLINVVFYKQNKVEKQKC